MRSNAIDRDYQKMKQVERSLLWWLNWAIINFALRGCGGMVDAADLKSVFG